MTSGLVLSSPDHELLPLKSLAQTVDLIAQNTPLAHDPGPPLVYNGDGMQVVGRVCELVKNKGWRVMANEELFAPLGMNDSDYYLLPVNPMITGGVRTTTTEYMKFLAMNGGMLPDGSPFVHRSSLAVWFENATDGLPVFHKPSATPDDYGFGSMNPFSFLVKCIRVL